MLGLLAALYVGLLGDIYLGVRILQEVWPYARFSMWAAIVVGAPYFALIRPASARLAPIQRLAGKEITFLLFGLAMAAKLLPLLLTSDANIDTWHLLMNGPRNLVHGPTAVWIYQAILRITTHLPLIVV